jgi:hypothetical protein
MVMILIDNRRDRKLMKAYFFGYYYTLNSGFMLARQGLCHLSRAPSPFGLFLREGLAFFPD